MEEEIKPYYAIFLYDSCQTYLYIPYIEDEYDLRSYSASNNYTLLSSKKFDSEKDAELFLTQFIGRSDLPLKLQLAITEHLTVDAPVLEFCLDI